MFFTNNTKLWRSKSIIIYLRNILKYFLLTCLGTKDSGTFFCNLFFQTCQNGQDEKRKEMKIKGGRTRHRGNLKRWPLHTVPPAEPSSPWSVPPLFLRVQGSGGKMFPCVVVLLALGHAMIFTSASSLKLAPWLSSRYSATSMLVAWYRFESIVLLLVVLAKTRSGFSFARCEA